MDILETTQRFLENWEGGGDAECRNLVAAPHSNPYDPDCNVTLTTVYHALLAATLASWSPKNPLSVDSLVAFIQSVVDHLPSSSSGTDKNPNIAAFGEVLVDILWAIDAELEEVLGDAKNAASAAEQGELSPTTVAQAVKAKDNAEADKETMVTLIRRLLIIGVLDPDICRERLDLGLVATVGLIADKLAFERKEIRTRTGLFYKQNKFNLLREQSEGYSKLTTELTSNLGPPHSPATGYPVESLEAIQARARPTWERALGLIGYFDLDPNRALDVILDVFSVHLATHHAFFLSLLSFSPWGGRRRSHVKQEDMAVEPDPEQYRGMSLDEVLRLAEEQAGVHSAVADSSNARVLAQVLGFKFTYYQSPEVTETVPRNLYLMTAILIREGFLTLEDLYPHIGPADEDMDVFYKAYLSSVDGRIAGAKVSQLAMAAPLESGPPGSRARQPAPEPKKEEPPKPAPSQKLGLVHALLSVGALRPALTILSKFPWMVDAYPELADLMIRVVHHSFARLYDTSVDVGVPTASTKEKLASFTTPRARYGATGVVPPPVRRQQLSLIAPTPPVTSTIEFVFFFPDWASRVPVCSSFDDLDDVVEPLLRFIGLHISRDPAVLTKFARIGRQHISTICELDPTTKKQIGLPDPSNPIMVFWLKVIRLYFLPCLSLMRGNAVCTVDIWNIVRQYETMTRWQLYGEWKASMYKSHPELRIRFAQADREAKGIMRRVSHQTVETLAATIAKLANGNPCIFFTNAVNQLMAYENLASVILQSLRFITMMGFDVLVYVIIDALANPNKERVKDDGVHSSDWLLNLSSFTGMLYSRYNADLPSLLKYIVHQLHNGVTTDIIIFRELIWRMAGIEPLPTLGDAAIAAMAGGPTLRVEAIASATRGARQDPNENSTKANTRLGQTLIKEGLARPLLIQIAQQRQSCVFQAPDAHLKSLASLFDTTHGVLLQYLDLLTTPAIIPFEEYSKNIVPPLADLGEKYGICAPICMQIYRPILNAALLASALALQEKERIASEEAEKRLKAALTAKREPNVTASRVASPNPAAENASTVETTSDAKPTVSASQSGDVVMESVEEKPPAPPENPWLPELYALFDDVKKIIPASAYEIIGPAFYLTFWQLSTYDLSPPTARYEEEYHSLRALARSEESMANLASRSSDREKRNTAGPHRDRQRKIEGVMAMLRSELKDQTASRSFTIKRLAREKQHWFAHNPVRGALAGYIIEQCIQPRCLLSPMDADFCVQFIKAMHSHGTPGFSTLQCYDKILGDNVKVVLFSCSEYEVRNYGRFLHGILADLLRWHGDEQLFNQENHAKGGSQPVALPGFENRRPGEPKSVLMPWSEFQLVLRKWHKKVAKCLEDCVKSGDFMHVYNTIVVLKEILPVFPIAKVYDYSGIMVWKAVEKLLEHEQRNDLKILANAYRSSLDKRRKEWELPILQKATTHARAPTQPETPRVGTPTASNAAPPDARRLPSTSSAPSAPKTHPNSDAPAPTDRSSTPNSTRLALDSIPRPEVVKRVRPDTRSNEENKQAPGDAMDVDQPPPRDNLVAPTALKVPSPIPPSLSQELRGSRPPTPNQPMAVRAAATKPLPSSPRGVHGIPPRPDLQQHMPPPAVPSQTPSAQELRETAKQSRITTNGSEKNDGHPPTEPRGQTGAPRAPSPRRRSPSPTSRPGTRNPSSESRASGDRRPPRDKLDDKRQDRDTRPERDISRRESARNERRAAREEREKEGDRDRDRRDRHGDRDRRDRDRDRERERDRDKERERERDREPDRHREPHRERDRDRDRDRDRHRRDDKERDRESRKDREGSGRGSNTATGANATPDERGLPTRPDNGREAGRHRGEDSLGKRRRGDDEADRPSKRSSRKDGHHDERPRRGADKDHERGARDSDRRRKDRDAADGDGKGLSIDTKLGDKRIPEGPTSAKTLPPSTPSAPRAMTSGDGARKPSDARERDRDRDRDREPREPRDREGWKRDQPPPNGNGPAPTSAPVAPEPSGGSLRARIGEREPSSARTAALAPASAGERDRKPLDDDRSDGGRKRTIADRERDAPEVTGNGGEPVTQAPKRPRLIRDRYGAGASGGGGLAKKLLPIDPQAADKARAARKD